MNFCYADFDSAFERCTPAYRELTQNVDAPAKVRNAEEGIIRLYELYADIFPTLSEVFYHGVYCDRIPEGEHRTCQQLAAQKAYLNKLKDNNGENPLNIYQKYYKRYFARVKAGSLREKKFRQWQYEAVWKRDACLKGTIPLEEFKDWPEDSMPNRAQKT